MSICRQAFRLEELKTGDLACGISLAQTDRQTELILNRLPQSRVNFLSISAAFSSVLLKRLSESIVERFLINLVMSSDVKEMDNVVI